MAIITWTIAITAVVNLFVCCQLCTVEPLYKGLWKAT